MAAEKRAAKAAATWFWIFTLVILKFLFVQIGASQFLSAKMPTALHGACQFQYIDLFQ